MIKSVRYLMVALALAVPSAVFTPGLSTPALASEPRLGSRLGNRLRAVPNPDINAERSAYRVAECKANRRSADARRFLDARTQKDIEASRAPLYRLENCNLSVIAGGPVEQVNVRLDDSLFRGMLAETLVKNEDDAKRLVGEPIERIYDRDWFAMTGRPPVLDEMAVCMVSVDPAPVLSLFKTQYDSDEQAAVIGAMGPLMGQCLVAGVKLEANALSLRTALGEAMYHRVFDPPVAKASEMREAAE